MKRNAIYFLGLFLAPAGAFFVPPTSSSKRTRWSASIGDFFPTLDTSALSLTSPGIKEAVLLLTPLSAFAGSAVVNQRRKEVVENLEFTQMAMNETQTIMTQSSNNFKVRLCIQLYNRASLSSVSVCNYNRAILSSTTSSHIHPHSSPHANRSTRAWRLHPLPSLPPVSCCHPRMPVVWKMYCLRFR